MIITCILFRDYIVFQQISQKLQRVQCYRKAPSADYLRRLRILYQLTVRHTVCTPIQQQLCCACILQRLLSTVKNNVCMILFFVRFFIFSHYYYHWHAHACASARNSCAGKYLNNARSRRIFWEFSIKKPTRRPSRRGVYFSIERCRRMRARTPQSPRCERVQRNKAEERQCDSVVIAVDVCGRWRFAVFVILYPNILTPI